MHILNKASKLVAAAVLLGTSSAWAQGENYDIYLLAGQSNADGRGEVGELVGDLAQYALPQPEHRIYFSNPGSASDREDIINNPQFATGWQTLEPGYSIEPGFGGPLLGGTFGPEVSFASEISEATGTDNKVGIIKVTDGGTSLAVDWRAPGSNSVDDEGGPLYSLLVNQARAALAALEAEGNTGTIRGLVWHQGESDTGGSGRINNYQDRFENFVVQLQADLGLDVLPTVIGELAPSREVAAFTDVQEDIDVQNELISLTRSDGLTTFGETAGDGDFTHLDTASQIELGRRFAQDLAELVVIPEPTTAAVLCLPLMALASRRRRA